MGIIIYNQDQIYRLYDDESSVLTELATRIKKNKMRGEQLLMKRKYHNALNNNHHN